MVNENSGERFSSVGYCGIADNNGKFLWSTNKRLFRRVSECERFVTARKSLAGIHTSFEVRMTFEGVRFRISSLPVPDKRLLCMAYPEECYIRYAYSEMYMRIFNIRRNAARSLSASHEIQSMLAELGAPEKLTELIEEQISFSEEIFHDSVSIGSLFDNEHICDYVEIEKKLKNSVDQIRKYNSAVGKTVTFDIRFSHKVARISYPVFETALLEIVRVIYKSMPEKAETCIAVADDMSGRILVSARTPLCAGFDPAVIDGEVRDIMCAFECLGGHTKIYLVDGNLVIKADAPAPLSNYIHRVKPDGYYAAHAEELKGYSAVIAPVSHRPDDEFILHSPKTEVEISMCALMADIMFSELIQTY